jgi:O-antigen/teichoic acid export membrane protein
VDKHFVQIHFDHQLFHVSLARFPPGHGAGSAGMSVKRNVIANYIGQGWRVLMGLAFVPLYIKYIGIESYGLIGIFAVLQAWLGLLDMGMRPALSREMARFTAGLHDAQSIRDLLRSAEFIGLVTAIVIAMGIWAVSSWLATDWLKADKLPVQVVAQSFLMMGIVAALSFIENLYVSSISGLQRQVLQNVIASIMATARGLGAACILIWVSPTVTAFFAWQGLISLIAVILNAVAVYSTLPSSPQPARFSLPALAGIWRFAGGMMAISLLSLLLTQVDKILLSKLLTLGAFAHYALAGTVANSLYLLTGPISTAFYPRLTELATQGDDEGLRAVYHQSAQMVTVLVGAAAFVLVAFSRRFLMLWTGDPALAQHVAPVMAVLVVGTMIHSLMWTPYHLQLAHGWTALSIKINIVALVILMPTFLWAVPKYGAIGAAWVWVTLNIGYLVFAIYFMHRRLLPNDKWQWYLQDVGLPLVSAALMSVICRWLMPEELSRIATLGALMLCSACVLAASALAAPHIRHQIAQRLPGKMRSIATSILKKHG